MPDTHHTVRYVAKNMRLDLRLIAEMIPHGQTVLDIGCGDGALLAHLSAEKGADARGIEIDMAQATHAVAAGLAVIQGDADHDLAFYPDGAFDYVILSRTLQAVERPREVLRQMLRIGRHAIVSFPNFGHWLLRWQLVSTGKMPVTETWHRRIVRDAEHPSLHDQGLLRPLRAGKLCGRTLAGGGRAGAEGALEALPPAGQPVRRAGAVPAAAGLEQIAGGHERPDA